jgi:5-methylcytosine-specific restriction protein A
MKRAAMGSNSTGQKRTDAFYLTPAWRALRSQIIEERGRRCEECGKTLEDDASPVKLTLDHTVERRDGGEDWSKANLRLLCTRSGGNGAGGLGGCNNRKTVRNRRERNGARPLVETGVDGWPFE